MKMASTVQLCVVSATRPSASVAAPSTLMSPSQMSKDFISGGLQVVVSGTEVTQ